MRLVVGRTWQRQCAATQCIHSRTRLLWATKQPETPAAQSEEAELQEAERLYTAELAQELQV